MAKSRSLDPSIRRLLEEVRDAQLPDPATRRKIRADAGVSLREVADAIGVDVMTVWRWEQDKARPRREHAVRYRELLDALQEAASV
jgi:DNA-binding transcriptional regulator YiaG